MRARWTALAWSLFGLYAALTAASLLLVFTGWTSGDQALVLLCAGYALVGALVAGREPGNAVGWLMLVIGVSFAATTFCDAYISQSGKPGEVWVAWVSSWGWEIWLYVSAVLLPLLFPDGRLVSRRWRPALWFAVAVLALSILTAMLKAGPLDVDMDATIANPTGVGGAIGSLLEAVAGPAKVLTAGAFLIGGASLLRRLQTSTGRAREQVKLFVYVGTVAIVALVFAMVDVFAEDAEGPTPAWADILGGIGWGTALITLVVGLPTAIGVAIMRHRLYDIDVVINRTLVYGSLTVLLGATYLVLVLGLRVVLSPLTGKSDLAVAASTLAVAGLFRPARARIQNLVDRRFFRSRYDAERTLEGFAGHLRNELDLEALGTDLRDVVTTTMQPQHVSLWLRRTP